MALTGVTKRGSRRYTAGLSKSSASVDRTSRKGSERGEFEEEVVVEEEEEEEEEEDGDEGVSAAFS